MWSRNRVFLGVIAAAGLALAGCSGSADGSAQPVHSTQQATATGKNTESSASQRTNLPGSSEDKLPQNGAPAVENPLDVGTLENDSCASITDKQAKQFSGEFVGAEMDDKGYCTWTYDKDPFHLGFIGGKLGLDDNNGLSAYYQGEQAAKSDPVDSVDGYPAVQYDLDLETEGNCVIVVGVRDDLTYRVLVELESEHPSYDDPCEVAREFAGVVVDNLKEAQ